MRKSLHTTQVFHPPLSLKTSMHFWAAVELSDDFVTGCWRAFKTTVWSYDAKGHSSMAVFYKYGRNHHLGM